MALSMSSVAATAGGGGALSTAAMAHHHQPAVITRMQAPKPPSGTQHHHGPSMALGADIIDKRLTRLARSTRHLPLVCVDLAGGGHVSRKRKKLYTVRNSKTLLLMKMNIRTFLLITVIFVVSFLVCFYFGIHWHVYLDRLPCSC
jgi:hypothetical protein